MTSRVGIWAVHGNSAQRVERSQLQLEIDLENWIEDNPSLLAEGLTVVGRQLHLDGGPLDLLCLDVQDRWVVVELKRGRLRRQAVAQAVDYAASIKSMARDDLADLVISNLGRLGPSAPTADELRERIDEQDEDRQVSIILAGAGIDAGLERIVSYLSEFDLPVRVVTFEVFETASGEPLLVREVIDDDERPAPRTRRTQQRSIEQIGDLGVRPEVIAAYRRIIDAADAKGLVARPFVRTVMITPPRNRNRYLIALKPDEGRGLRISHGPEAFEEFFPGVTANDVEESLGNGEGAYFDGTPLEAQVRRIEEFLSELPATESEADDEHERTAFLERVIDLTSDRVTSLGYGRGRVSNRGYAFIVSKGDSRWRLRIRCPRPADGLRAYLYVSGETTTAENEALLEQITKHADMINGALASEHELEADAHRTNALARKAAFAVCRWPGYGYGSPPEEAADRIVEFCTGVAAAADAAGL